MIFTKKYRWATSTSIEIIAILEDTFNIAGKTTEMLKIFSRKKLEPNAMNAVKIIKEKISLYSLP